MTSHFIRYFARRAESIRFQLGLTEQNVSSVEEGKEQTKDGKQVYFAPAPIPNDSAPASSMRGHSSPPGLKGVLSDKGKGLEEYSGEPNDRCAFCEIINEGAPCFKVYEDEHVLAFLDILPIREGHLLVVPSEFLPAPFDLGAALHRGNEGTDAFI